MKLTKSQLKELIKEEIGNIFEDEGEETITQDTQALMKRFESSGIQDRIKSLINTPKEFLEMVSWLVDTIEMRQDQELILLKKFIMQLPKKIKDSEAATKAAGAKGAQRAGKSGFVRGDWTAAEWESMKAGYPPDFLEKGFKGGK